MIARQFFFRQAKRAGKELKISHFERTQWHFRLVLNPVMRPGSQTQDEKKIEDVGKQERTMCDRTCEVTCDFLAMAAQKLERGRFTGEVGPVVDS
jgi:hypothetical protein